MAVATKTISVIGNPIEITWLDLWPITQVYGVLLNTKNEVLVLQKSNGKYTLPGGKPETGETIYETLCREAKEEADVEIGNLKIIGANRVSDPKLQDESKKQYFQLRLIGRVVRELPRTVDPASGEVWSRSYCQIKDLNKVLNWKSNGQEMVKIVKMFLRFEKI